MKKRGQQTGQVSLESPSSKEDEWLSFLEHHSDVTKTNVSLICSILHWPSCPWGRWTEVSAGS